MTTSAPVMLAITLQPTDLLVPAAGLLIVIYALWMIIKQKRQRAGQPPAQQPRADGVGGHLPPRATPTRPPNPRNDPAARVGRDLEDLAGEIEQLMRRLGADVDQRSARLEALLREADQKIAELNRLQAQGGAADTFAASSEPLQTGDPSARMTSGTDDPVARSVYALADAGHDPVAIARQLKEHVGKVELILALRRG